MAKKRTAKKMKCCGSGKGMIIPHLLVLVGAYVLSSGLTGSAAMSVVLKSAEFWGLILILAGFCGFAAAHHKATAMMCK